MAKKKLIQIPTQKACYIQVSEAAYKSAMKIIHDSDVIKVSQFADEKGLEISYETKHGYGTIFLKHQTGK